MASVGRLSRLFLLRPARVFLDERGIARLTGDPVFLVRPGPKVHQFAALGTEWPPLTLRSPNDFRFTARTLDSCGHELERAKPETECDIAMCGHGAGCTHELTAMLQKPNIHGVFVGAYFRHNRLIRFNFNRG